MYMCVTLPALPGWPVCEGGHARNNHVFAFLSPGAAVSSFADALTCAWARAVKEWSENMSPQDFVFGVFYVAGSLRVQGPQRLKFSFDEAMLKLRDRRAPSGALARARLV